MAYIILGCQVPSNNTFQDLHKHIPSLPPALNHLHIVLKYRWRINNSIEPIIDVFSIYLHRRECQCDWKRFLNFKCLFSRKLPERLQILPILRYKSVYIVVYSRPEAKGNVDGAFGVVKNAVDQLGGKVIGSPGCKVSVTKPYTL